MRNHLLTFMALSVAQCSLLSSAHAAPQAERVDIEKAIRSNNAEELSQVLKTLGQNGAGRDAHELTFYRALYELKRDQYDTAIGIFSSIPSSSAYYLDARNNIAAIHAMQGRSELAKSTLEETLNSSQPLAIIHKNLNNLKSHLAFKGYASALQAMDSAKNTKPSLVILSGNLVREQHLAALATGKDKNLASAPSTGETSTKVAEPALSAEINKTKTTEIGKTMTPPPSPTETTSRKTTETNSKAAPASAALPASPEVKSSSKPAKPDTPAGSASDEEQIKAVKQALNDWSAAWEKKDIERYIKSYSDDFTPSDGKSHASWARDRQDRILSKGSIRIRLSKLDVSMLSSTHARIRFRQHYDSDKLKTSSEKTIEMKWIDRRWLITLERTPESSRK